MNLRDEIKDELQEMAPYLSSFTRSHPFKIPVDYFEEMERKLILVNRNPFSVPDDYFNDLPSIIISKIQVNRNEKSKDGKIRTIAFISKRISGYKLWLAAASVAAIAVVSTTLFIKHRPYSFASSQATTESVASDLLNASDVDEAMVVELYLQAQQQSDEKSNSADNVNDDNNFLRDVTDIDPYSITGM